MSIESDAKEIFAEVRQFYKGTLKSINKVYVAEFATPEKHLQTMNRLARYNSLNPRPLRAHKMQVIAKRKELKGNIAPIQWGYERAHMLKSHYDSADKELVAGNCGEMCIYAFWCVIQKNISWDTCLVQLGGQYVNHGFCCMGDMTPFRDHAFNDLKNIEMDQGSIPWVIDPWANCCSPLNLYSEALAQKMAKWDGDGKRILAPYASAPNQTEIIRPIHYVDRCLHGNLKIQIALSIGSRSEDTHS